MTEQPTLEPREKSTLERLMGDRPSAVIVRLVILSLVVGFLMSMYGLDVQSIVYGTVDLFRDALRDSSGLMRSAVGYIVTGAALVIPIWLLLRLTSAGRRK